MGTMETILIALGIVVILVGGGFLTSLAILWLIGVL